MLSDKSINFHLRKRLRRVDRGIMINPGMVVYKSSYLLIVIKEFIPIFA